MHFLCLRHRQQLAVRSQDEKLGLWFQWMSEAAMHFELGQHREAVSWCGCSYELMSDLLADTRPHGKCAATKLVLSASYLAQGLTAMGEEDKARMMLGTAFQRLGMALHDEALAPWLRECMATLLDGARRQLFFARYLNLPWVDAQRPVTARLH